MSKLLRTIGEGLQGFNNGLLNGLQMWRMIKQDELARQREARQDELMRDTLRQHSLDYELKSRQVARDDEFAGQLTGWMQNGGASVAGNGKQPGPSASVDMPKLPAGQIADLVDWTGRYHGLDPSIWSRQIAAESGGNPNIVSPRGAKGLAQLMAGTASDMGLAEADIFDPYKNLMAGAKYMRQQLDAHGGDYGKALWAYNAGPGSVQKGVMPAESRAYVAKVLGLVPKGQDSTGSNTLAANGGTASDVPPGYGMQGQGINPNQTVPIGGKQFTLAQLANNERFISMIGEHAMKGSQKAKDFFGVLKAVREMTTPNKLDGAQAYEAQFGKRFDPTDANAAAWVKSYNQANSTQQVNVHNNLPPEQDHLQKKQGEAVQTARDQIAKDADSALKTLITLDYAEPLLSASGSLADIKKTVGGLAQGLGLSGQFGGLIEAANDINTLQALSARLLLPIVQNTTAFHTNFSDADRRSIESMNISPQNLPEVNRRLMEMAREEAGLALEKQKHFTGLKDYADYEARIAGWNQGQAKRLEEKRAKRGGSPSDVNAGPAPAVAPTYKTPEDVRAAYKSGSLSEEQAASILKSQFGME